ncbi:fumarate hydratase C-terminal domain-containing protein [uncultured Draconibacterium sp.]|uniref:fumarate hydratase C-terminal domain-containing protein n=1 Tax=uncultured Draconibacterium sp. TaxID=1573823 RepID=UPI0029C61FCB|nr:fumarate hydratase C-terminal domain-containing protein [uncultured Draconibacterium sp.]
MISIATPISESDISNLKVGDMVSLSGFIYTGRDAVLPKIVSLIKNDQLHTFNINLKGSVIFHTAVSPAGVGPTSSNKFDIESSIPSLSKAGVKLHLGKGALKPETIAELNRYNSVFAVIPPVTALLEDKTISKKVVAFPELGMEALHLLEIKDYPAIIAAVNGKSIYDEL